jgi:hypothetical protein
MPFNRVQSIMPLLIRQPVIDCAHVFLLVSRIAVKGRNLAVGKLRKWHHNCVLMSLITLTVP